MRTLPLRLAPVDGESLPGYVTRYAGRYRLQPSDVLGALGLEGVDRYGVCLSDAQRERAAHGAGLDADALQTMLLASFAGRAFPHPPALTAALLAGRVAAREASVWATRLCPHCLAEDGVWRVRWQLSWSVACARHEVLLARRCSRCQTPPRIGTRARWPRDEKGELVDATRCASRDRGALCRASLIKTTVSASPALIAAQRRIDALLDGTDTKPRLAGQELVPPVYLRDLRVLALLARTDTPPTRRSRGERACGGSHRQLDDPLQLAAVLPAALALADLPNPDALADALRQLADRRYDTSNQTLRAFTRRADTSPVLAGALRHAASQAVYAIPSARLGIDPRAYRRPDDLDGRLQAHHVPQLFWADDYDQHLAELFDFDDFSRWHGRRFCSVLLARMLAPFDWRAAVGYLDFGARFVNEGYNTTFVKLRQVGRYDELAARIKQAANEHAEGDLVDYKQRRALLADWSGIDPATWSLLAPRTRARNPDTPTRASVWLWCQITSGHERAAPIAPSNPELRRQTEFERRHIDALRQPLTLLGELLLTTPAAARSTLTNRLAAAMHQHGQLPARSWRHSVDSLLSDRILAHTSAHTGVDIPSLTTPSICSRAPAAVTHARLLAATLLRHTAHASWDAVATVIGGSAKRHANNDRAYRAALADDATLAAELGQLERAVADWHNPAPATPNAPHHERMPEIAAAIQAHAAELFPPHIAPRTSMLACRAHTDLTWPQIAALHDLPAAHPALTHATIARRQHDPDFAERYQRLLDRAEHVRDAAGYRRAQLARGLTTPKPRAPQDPP